MPTRSDKVSPALKPGGYSESNLLPLTGADRKRSPPGDGKPALPA